MILKALVAEDKPTLRRDIVDTINAEPFFEVIGEAEAVNDCYNLIRAADELHVLFLDIKIYGGTCFHLLQRLREHNIAIPPTVILSGGNEKDYVYEIASKFSEEIVFFIEKPFNFSWKYNRDELRAKIFDALGLEEDDAPDDAPQPSGPLTAPVEFIEAYNGSRLEIIPTDTISFVEKKARCKEFPVAGLYVYSSLQQEPLRAKIPFLNELQDKLGTRDFVNGHRDLILRKRAIKALEKRSFSDAYNAIMRFSGEPVVELSKGGSRRVKEALGL